jgi:hypothetical protein
MRVNRMSAHMADKDRIAISGLRKHCLRCNRTRRTGPVLNHHWLARVLGELLRNQAGNPIR